MAQNIAPLAAHCAARGITVQAYSPLGGGGKNHNDELISGDLVTSIGKAHGKTGAQVGQSCPVTLKVLPIV